MKGRTMQITSFCPHIVSPNAAELVALFEELGFERKHTKTGIEGAKGDVTSYDLKYGDQFHVHVAQSTNLTQDLTMVRINVRDFDEAYDYFVSKGFKNAQGDKVTNTSSSKATLLISPSGFGINLVEHIRK